MVNKQTSGPCPKCGCDKTEKMHLMQSRGIKADDRFLYCDLCSLQVILPRHPLPTYRVDPIPPAVPGAEQELQTALRESREELFRKQRQRQTTELHTPPPTYTSLDSDED